MRVWRLSSSGIAPAAARKIAGRHGDYYALVAGEQGRGRWEYRIPLVARDFPVQGDRIDLAGIDFRLIDIKREDSAGQSMYLLARGTDDGHHLLVWRLEPGYRGSASYFIEGDARQLACGRQAQGDAGRMGGAPVPVVLVTGACRLQWHRTGRLYGTPAHWTAEYDGHRWTVATDDAAATEDAALHYDADVQPTDGRCGA